MAYENDSFNDLLPGKLFGVADVEDGPIQVTIKGFAKGTLGGKDGAEAEPASFITFADTDRRLVVKPHTVENLTEMFGGSKSAAIGQVVEMYKDPNVKYGGKKVGGLRLRKPTTTDGKAPF